MPNAMVQIQTISLASTTASVTFSNLPQNYRDFRVVLTGPGATGGVVNLMYFNGDTGGNYSHQRLYGDGTGGAGADSGTHAGAWIGNIYGNDICTIVDIMEATVTTKHKAILSHSGMGAALSVVDSGRWFNTSPVTSITVGPNGASLLANTKITVFGVIA